MPCLQMPTSVGRKLLCCFLEVSGEACGSLSQNVLCQGKIFYTLTAICWNSHGKMDVPYNSCPRPSLGWTVPPYPFVLILPAMPLMFELQVCNPRRCLA